MKLIPEYKPVGRLYLSFVHEFFNTRFNYGKAICEISKIACKHTEVEIFVSASDRSILENEMKKNGFEIETIKLNLDSPKRSILAEYMPVFGETGGDGCALIFENSYLDLSKKLVSFSRRLAKSIGLKAIELHSEFATAAVSVNENICLISSDLANRKDGCHKFFIDTCPDQCFISVPSLAEEITHDLDTYLWPIRPGVWIVSKYPDNTPQAVSIQPAVSELERYGHELLRVPGLSPIRYDDINTIPNYTNGILINDVALFPSYNRQEDDIVAKHLQHYGYEAYPIDSRDIILSNSGPHCISKTVPKQIIKSEKI